MSSHIAHPARHHRTRPERHAEVGRPRFIDSVRVAATTVVPGVISGLLHTLGFPPLDAAPLGALALIPLLWVAATQSPWRAACAGLCFGFTVCATLAWYFPAMVSGFFGGNSALATIAIVGATWAWYAWPYAPFAAWVAWRARRGGIGPGGVAAALVVTEFVRAEIGFANPIGLLGYTQTWLVLVQSADLGGPYVLSALLAATSAALLGVRVPQLAGAHPRLARAVVVCAWIGVVAYGAVRMNQSFGDGHPVKVSVAQGALASSFHPTPEEAEARARRYLDLTRALAAQRPDLVVWPEFSIDFYPEERGAEQHALLVAGWSLGADIVVGAPHYETTPSQTRYHNSAYLLREGEIAGRYDKQRLLPFAESDPFGTGLAPARVRFTAGTGNGLLETAAGPLGVMLCSEGLHPGEARARTRAGARILANPSSDAWFGHPAPARLQRQMAAFRAVETRRPLLRPTGNGSTAIIDAHGRTVAIAAWGEATALSAEIEGGDTTTLYTSIGEWPVVLALVLCGFGTARSRRADESMRHERS